MILVIVEDFVDVKRLLDVLSVSVVVGVVSAGTGGPVAGLVRGGPAGHCGC
jgi:hypothetical protein